MRRPRGEEGTITVLVVGFAVILLLLVAVVVDVSVVVLARRGSSSAADGAAVAAAQQLDVGAVYDKGLTDAIPLSEELVDSVVSQYESDAGQGQPGLRLVPAVDAALTTVTVTATRDVRLPFAAWFGIQAVTVTSVAHARAPLVAP
jgi:Flp pilus assembly protein TadG